MRFFTSTLIILLFAILANSQIIINEISYNPPESGTDTLEYIELFNSGPSEVDITGWYFNAGVIDTFPSVILLPGEFFVTAASSSAMMNVFHINTHQWVEGALNNSGEPIVLVDAGGNVIDSVFYDDSDPWPVEPDGNGPSLELMDPGLDNSDGINWQFSGGATGVIINGNEVKGTPGAVNSSGGTSGPAITVIAANLEFTPKHAVVALGDSVRWVNQEVVPHNVNGTQDVYPNNPEDFFSGTPAPGPWQYDHEFNTEGLHDYHCDAHVLSGMRGTVAVYDPDGYTAFPFIHLRLTDGVNGQHIFTGVPTVVTGVVHGINFQPSGYSFFVVNQHNVGINVFSFDPGSYVVTEGDEVEVKGVISQFNGLLEIIPDEINIISTSHPLTPPELFQELSEENEGSHLALSPFTIDSIVPDASGMNVFVKDDQNQSVTIRVDNDLGVTAVDIFGSNAVRGIGIQFDNSFPFTSGYQLMALEFATVSSVQTLARDHILMSPNPASGIVRLSGVADIRSVHVYSPNGQLVLSDNHSGRTVSLNISSLHEGHYIIRAETVEGIWISTLVKN